MATQSLKLDPPRLSALTRTSKVLRIARPSARERVGLGGVLIDRVTSAMAADYIRGFVSSGTSHQIVTVNLDFLTIAGHMPAFRDTLNMADLAVADGMPLVWASHLKGRTLPERVAGVELVDTCCRIAVERGGSVYLLGAAEGVAAAAARRLSQRYPGLRIAGTYSPPFGPISADEDARIISHIQAARPTMLFVAFGAPRQDLWIREHLAELGVPVAVGVGCVFDLLAGRVTRAPAWMRRSGLEWAFRLGQEPRRLWRRYASDLPTLVRLLGGSLEAPKPLSRPYAPTAR